MHTRKIGVAALGLVLLMGVAALGQEDIEPIFADEALVIPQEPNFYLAIIVGVILAVSFELILTHLSVAAGISAIPSLERDRAHHSGPSAEHSRGGASPMHAVNKTTSAFGVWALITATVSLFFASWLAVELSNTPNVFSGLVLGLAIWALFYILMTVIEVSALTSLVGSLMQTAVTGLRSAYKATTSVFAKSEEDRVVDTAERVTAAVRDELFADVDTKHLHKRIEQYVQELRPASPEEIRRELSRLLDHTEIKALVEHEESPFMDVEVLTAELENEPGMNREKARSMATNVRSAFSQLREEYKSDKDAPSKVSDAAMRMSGRSEEDARATREKIENYLRSTGKDELNPDGIKRDLEKLLHSPKEGTAALRERLSHFDRSTLKAGLAQRKDMNEQDAERTADRIMSVVDRIRGTAHEKAASAQGAAAGTSEEVRARRHGAESKVRNYMNSLGRPELRYEGIKHDMQVLFHDPKAGADLLIRRLKAMDRDTFKAIVASRRDVSPEDAEHIVSQIERARDESIAKYERMKTEVQHRMEDARDRAIHEAEEARKAARTAAWWTFGSAVASAAAAVVGGVLSTYT